MKAVFLVNFTKFVEWPPEAFSAPGSPVVIGVLGEDPFGALLDQAAAGETAGGRPLAVRRFRSLAALEPCHVLFIAESQEGRLAEILHLLRAAPTLTVADMDGFAARGGAVQFRREGGRLRFVIRPEAAERVRLKVSSRLLGLAGAAPGRRP
ncbi:MAG: YfiR family protein [Elusimicrobia bacterium]|nr:YfiR family protein [Elusimicrobiota bacterium]